MNNPEKPDFISMRIELAKVAPKFTNEALEEMMKAIDRLQDKENKYPECPEANERFR